jgi:PEP-CTERM motif
MSRRPSREYDCEIEGSGGISPSSLFIPGRGEHADPQNGLAQLKGKHPRAFADAGPFFLVRRRHMKFAIGGIIVLSSTTFLLPAQAATYSFLTDIPIPASPSNIIGGKFAAFDISAFDPATQLDYVADRSNSSVDVFSAANNTFVTRIGGSPPTFAGALPPDPVGGPNSTSGPDGVVVVNMGTQHQVFVGDGPSIVWNFNINGPSNTPTFTQNPTIPTGGHFRADEMAFDPITNTVLVANNADQPAFGTLINAKTGSVIVSNIQVPQGGNTGGLEASDFNPVTKTFFISVPQINNGAGPQGGVAEINPTTGAVMRVIDLAAIGACSGAAGCSPSGLAAAKNGQILIGDANSGPGTAGAMIIDPTGVGPAKVIATFPNINGIDEVWYDPTTNKWFLAAGNNNLNSPGGNKPELVIIDAATDMITQIIQTTPGDHSVSVDPISGEIFVPFAANAANNVCPNGCIAVFSAVPEPSTWAMMLLGFLGLAFAFRTKRRVMGVA